LKLIFGVRTFKM